MGLLALRSVVDYFKLPLSDVADQLLRVGIMAAVLWFIARPVIDLRVRHWAATVAIGVVVFVIWIAPDMLIKGYRHFWLFENALMPKVATTLSTDGLMSWPVLTLRMIRAVLIVPIVEELFWRAWLMRWLIGQDFERVPLGEYTAQSFWVVAVLFASEHGPYWDVGLAAGIVYNWWMVRTRSLGDLILTHAVTNFCLGAYVIATGKWEYWL
jgi:CAAX prenyl protease-like protein